MFRWLQGPGSVFKDPLPGSTNYLNAYDQNGQLIRSSEKASPREPDEAPPASIPGGDEAVDPSEKNIASGQPIPRELAQDLMPFPLNRQFRSQAVLSEELREEIWERVVRHGKTVKVVSAELGVEMNRVGAVVRLKSVEKEWLEKVRRRPFLSPPPLQTIESNTSCPYDEIQVKFD